MNKKLKVCLLVVIILILLVVASYCAYAYYVGDIKATNAEKAEISNNLISEEVNNITNNVISQNNTVILNNTIEKNNTVEKNEVKNTVKQNVVSSNNDSELESDNDEEKALEIVKKDWGSTQGVYFKVKTIDANGNYVISVNNSADTSVLSWYTVNPKTGEFTN